MTFKNEKSERIQEGLILHLILSKLNSRDELNQVMNKIRVEESLSTSEINNFHKKVSNLFDSIPEFNSWFSSEWEVVNERPIITNGQVYVPDKILLSGSKTIIIDYKREKHDDKHKVQIKNYGDLLSKMGYQVQGLYLVYVNDVEVVKVI